MFERVYCISLERRADRYEEFLKRLPQPWPFEEIRKFTAIDGSKVSPPSWWKQGPGAWGCYQSHLAIIQECMNAGVKSVLIMEDDCQFVDNFLERWQQESQSLPEWEQLYLGGQLLKSHVTPVKKLNDIFLAPHNVNRTHAYALQGNGIKIVYHHLLDVRGWKDKCHIDHHLGRLHESRKIKVVSPVQWYCGQYASKSDINGKEQVDRTWEPPAHVTSKFKLKTKPLVLIIGLHRSGSSCIAGIHHHLGVHMGHKFSGCEMNGGYEAQGIARLCENAMPYPGTDINMESEEFRQRFDEWYLTQNRTAIKRIVGAKYPHLCVFAPWLMEQYAGNIKIVHCERDVEKSIASLQRRDRHIPKAKCAAVQRFLNDHKQEFLASLDGKYHTVNYEELLKEPERVVRDLAAFLDLPYSAAAAKYVNPAKQHIK